MATAKRIRCICGKIYDPSEHAAGCPACGVQVTIQRISIVGPEQQSTTAPSLTNAASSIPAPAAPAALPPVSPANLPWVWIIGGLAVFGFLIIASVVGVVLWLRPKPVPAVVIKDDPPNGIIDHDDHEKPGGGASGASGQTDKVVDNGSSGNSPSGTNSNPDKPKPGGSSTDSGTNKSQSGGNSQPTTASDTPPPPPFKYNGKKVTLEGRGNPDENGAELIKAISDAGDGDTIVLRGQPYRVERIVDKAIRIMVETNGSPVVILGTKRSALSVAAKNVTLEGIVFDQSGSLPAIMMQKGSELRLENCSIMSKSNSALVAVAAAKLIAVETGFGCPGGNLVTIRGPTEVGMYHCDFTGSLSGFRMDGAVVANFYNTKFHEIGAEDGSGLVVSSYGSGSSVLLDNCEVKNNRAGLIAKESGTLTVKGGAFTGNGVTGQNGLQYEGLIVATKGGKATIDGATFDANLQGLKALDAGLVSVANSHFTRNGIVVEDKDVQYHCYTLVATGRDSTMVARGCDFSQSNTRVVTIVDGAALTMENCRLLGGAGDNLSLGGGEPCRITMKECLISGFTTGGMVARVGTLVTVDDCEFRGNKLGIEAREEGKVEINNTVMAENSSLGLLVHAKGEAIVTGCTFDSVNIGAQAGFSGKTEEGGGELRLGECKFSNNRLMDVRACIQSRAILRNCTFADGAGPKVVREQGGSVEADPPVQIVASVPSQNQPQGQGGKTIVPAQKPTASNNKSPSRPQQPSQPPRNTPSGSQTVPGKVDEVIDVIDKIKRIIR
jgi:hypothetical protein